MLGGLLFERHGGFPADCWVSASGMIDAVDVCEEGDFDLVPGLPVSAPDPFGLQRFEGTFDGGFIVTIAFPAHRWLEAGLSQKLLIVMCALLRPAIRVVDAAWRRSAVGGLRRAIAMVRALSASPA